MAGGFDGGGSGRGIGGMAGSRSEYNISDDKENDFFAPFDDYYEENKQKSAGRSKASNSSKRRLSSVTECGEVEDMAGMEERLALAVTWFRNHYYEHSTSSVSRSGLFEKYCRMCENIGTEPMNMATLGKHIRSVFPNIITRRLGIRGNSKYHYYGLAEVGVSSENFDFDDDYKMPVKKTKAPSKTPGKRRKAKEVAEVENGNGSELMSGLREISGKNIVDDREYQASIVKLDDADDNPPNYEEFLRLQHEICTFSVGEEPADISSDDFKSFCKSYHEHTVEFLRLIYERDFTSIERCILNFWTGLSEEQLRVLQSEVGSRIISVADDYLYQVCISLLIPEVTDPYPLPSLQAVRIFAKSIEGWFTSVASSTGIPVILGNHQDIPEVVVEAKIDLAKRFATILRRRTSVNHLAQAMQSVIYNKHQVQQMIHDWDHIDFASIRDQVKTVIGTKEPFISYIEVSVKSYLFEDAPMTMWTHWLENLIEQYIAVDMASGQTLDKASKSLILGWSFYQTLILRDLTLRSAGSFGSFHILRLFLEEYVVYYIERKLDEHRRAVGVLACWPLMGSSNQSESVEGVPRSTYDDYLEEHKSSGLHLMSSVADDLENYDAVQSPRFDRFTDINNLLS